MWRTESKPDDKTKGWMRHKPREVIGKKTVLFFSLKGSPLSRKIQISILEKQKKKVYVSMLRLMFYFRTDFSSTLKWEF